MILHKSWAAAPNIKYKAKNPAIPMLIRNKKKCIKIKKYNHTNTKCKENKENYVNTQITLYLCVYINTITERKIERAGNRRANTHSEQNRIKYKKKRRRRKKWEKKQ